jgi:hypothetical protein
MESHGPDASLNKILLLWTWTTGSLGEVPLLAGELNNSLTHLK